MIHFQWLIIHPISLLNLSNHNLYEHPDFCGCLHLSFLSGLPRWLDNNKMPRFREIFSDDESANDEHEELSSSPHQKDNVDIIVWLRETSEESKPRTQTKMESQNCWLGGVHVDGIPLMLMPNPVRTQGVLARVKQLKSISFLVPFLIMRTGKEKSIKNARSACKSRWTCVLVIHWICLEQYTMPGTSTLMNEWLRVKIGMCICW
jgi:hypothetical protein